MKNRIEILMAVYNGEQYLSEQLQSIFNQTERDFSITIRDNCSTDGTSDILEAWESKEPGRIRVIYGKENLGALGNFGKLLEQADADYVMFSDADDFWLPEKIEKTFKALKAIELEKGASHPILVHTDLCVANEELKVIHNSFWKLTNLDGQSISFPRTLVENAVTGCTMMINRALLVLIKPIPLEIPMHDTWTALVASAFGTILALSEPTILYRQHGKNQVGATPYGLSSFFGKKKREQIAGNRQKRLRQAELFYERFQSMLSPAQKKTLQIYMEARKSWLPRKVYLLNREKLFETGFLRKLYQVLAG